jgi:DNA polymerase-3 subunit beta
MKINVSRNHLFAKLQAVGKIVKSGKDISYSSFLFDITGEKLIVTGSDDGGQIKTSIDCNIEEPENVQFMLDAHILLSALKELPEQPLTIELSNSASFITLVYHKGKFEIPALEADLFPKMKQQKDDAISITINSALLRKGFKVGKFSELENVLRPIMSNVNFSSKNNHFAFAASDGHRLGVYEEDTMEQIPDFDLNIPTKIAKIISGLLLSDDMEVAISFDDRNARFEISDITVTYLLFEGKYPNYRNVIPKTSSIIVKVDCAELIAAVNRVSVFSDESMSMIILSLKENNLNLTAESIDYGRSAKENMMLDAVYPEIRIGFKSSFLLDILKTIDTNVCEIHLNNPQTAAVFKPNESDDSTFLLMPLMINN